jgi:hypothetical protein
VQPIDSDRASRTLTSNITWPIVPSQVLGGYNINDPNLGYQPRGYGSGYRLPEKILSYTASIQQQLPGNAILTVAFALLFALSGFFLWLGERDHRFIFAGTGTVHDILMYLSVALLVGHLYLALIHPSTRHALRGMTTGEVDVAWAAKHHAKWIRELRR